MNNTVYVSPARGNGKSLRCRKYILDLMDAGYKVTPVYITPNSELRGRRYESVIVDKDILTPAQYERAERMLADILKGERHGLRKMSQV